MSNPIKPTLKTELIPLLLVIASIALSFYFYANFPDQVPIHWNAAGEVDNYSSKAVGAFLFPGITLALYLLLLVLPFVDPKKDRYLEFRKTYHYFKGFITAYLFAIYLLASIASLGYPISINLWMPVLVGSLFVLLGNYMSKIKPNWFMGIRTPWTLSSEEVWNKTHRLGGKLFILSGILIAGASFMPVAFRMPTLLVAVFSTVVITIAYSYILFRGEEKKDEDNQKSEQSNN
jgi:uncharacterized membrane protein